MTQSKCAGGLWQSLVVEWDIVLTNINNKRNQSAWFQANVEMIKSAFHKLILQWVTFVSIEIRYRVTCRAATMSCFSLQHWPINQYVDKTYSNVSDSYDRGKDTAAVFADFLYNGFDYPVTVNDIRWSDRPPSVFKNKFTVKFLQSLSQKHKRFFSRKDFTASQKKLLMKFVAKLRLVYAKGMSKVIHISQEEISARISEVID